MTFKVQDHYFKKAKKENFLARSVYKLEEIDQKYRVLNQGNNVLDLGYYPGSWIQYTSNKIGPSGNVVGIDIKPISDKIKGLLNVQLYSADFLQMNDNDKMLELAPFDVVLSDMAPNTTGIKGVDQARSLELDEKVASILPKVLKNGGNMVVKIFDSQDAQDFIKEFRKFFKEDFKQKPKSTRSISKEFFLIGKGYKNGSV